jgi:hypothetical protein
MAIIDEFLRVGDVESVLLVRWKKGCFCAINPERSTWVLRNELRAPGNRSLEEDTAVSIGTRIGLRVRTFPIARFRSLTESSGEMFVDVCRYISCEISDEKTVGAEVLCILWSLFFFWVSFFLCHHLPDWAVIAVRWSPGRWAVTVCLSQRGATHTTRESQWGRLQWIVQLTNSELLAIKLIHQWIDNDNENNKLCFDCVHYIPQAIWCIEQWLSCY